MTAAYETEAQRVRKRLRETLTPKERWANWWDYHKLHVVIAVIGLAVLCYVIVDGRRPKPDYTIGWVSGLPLDETVEADIIRRFTPYAEDLNGDGRVEIGIHQINLDLGLVLDRGGSTDGQQELGELLELEADLDVGQSGIFLTDDPAAFQAYTGALLYRDGSEPDEGSADWEDMVISWEQKGIGTVYAGCRGCWKTDWRETWEQYWALWERAGGRSDE